MRTRAAAPLASLTGGAPATATYLRSIALTAAPD